MSCTEKPLLPSTSPFQAFRISTASLSLWPVISLFLHLLLSSGFCLWPVLLSCALSCFHSYTEHEEPSRLPCLGAGEHTTGREYTPGKAAGARPSRYCWGVLLCLLPGVSAELPSAGGASAASRGVSPGACLQALCLPRGHRGGEHPHMVLLEVPGTRALAGGCLALTQHHLSKQHCFYGVMVPRRAAGTRIN